MIVGVDRGRRDQPLAAVHRHADLVELAADLEGFGPLPVTQRVACIEQQYGGYTAVADVKVNGKLTLGENIADLSGLQIAYKAYHRSLNGQAAPVIDGLGGDQRFYLGWAQAWRAKSREERALQLLTIDTHSPDQFRANGAAINSDGYPETFGTKPGDKMYKPSEARIRIW